MDAVAPDTLVRQFLAERDVRCRRCDYSLRGLPSPRCPECGAEHELGLIHHGLPPAPKPWSVRKTIHVAGLAYSTAAACWASVAVVAAAADLWPVCAICALAGAIPLCARIRLCWSRRRLERLDGVTRATIGETAWVWAGIALCVTILLTAAAAAARGL